MFDVCYCIRGRRVWGDVSWIVKDDDSLKSGGTKGARAWKKLAAKYDVAGTACGDTYLALAAGQVAKCRTPGGVGHAD